MRVWTFIGLCALLLAAPTTAQEKPAEKTVEHAASPQTAAKESAPTVPAEAQQAFDAIGRRARGMVEAIAILQKEVDVANADLGRLVQQLQKPGWKLTTTPSGQLTYVKTDEPPPPAKKKDGSQ